MSSVLIGRAPQMAALGAALEAACQGSPATLLIGGEAGVGKSRLVSEFSSRARAAGARVVAGECLELGADGLPFAPFTAMLRDLVRELGPDQVTGLLPGGSGATRELARLLPELGRGGLAPGGTGTPASSGGPVSSGDSAGEARARLFEEFLTLLERLAEGAPLVVVVEDAHWADRSSRDLLAFLTGYQRTLRQVLIVVTFRSDELHRTHPLRPLLAELGRIDWVERMELPRLTPGRQPNSRRESWAVRRLLTWRTGCSSGPRGTRCSLRNCCAASAGAATAPWWPRSLTHSPTYC
jgi:predicted ATPase